jgi:transposase
MHKFEERHIAEIKDALKQAKDKGQYQRVMAVWLRARCGLKAKDVAESIGWSMNSVHQVQSRYWNEGAEVFEGPGRGGRRRENLSLAKEDALLSPFIEKAKAGGVLAVSEIRQAYEIELGASVSLSTVYRMLARHGWRKIAPRPRHPKSDLEAQASFKKTSGAFGKRSGASGKR